MKYNLSAIMSEAHTRRAKGYTMSQALKSVWRTARAAKKMLTPASARFNPDMAKFLIAPAAPTVINNPAPITSGQTNEDRLFLLEMKDTFNSEDWDNYSELKRRIREGVA